MNDELLRPIGELLRSQGLTVEDLVAHRRRTRPSAPTSPEYNIVKWGNPAEVVRTYVLEKDVTMYFGRVDGGEGYQALIPEDLDPESILRLVGARPL